MKSRDSGTVRIINIVEGKEEAGHSPPSWFELLQGGIKRHALQFQQDLSLPQAKICSFLLIIKGHHHVFYLSRDKVSFNLC
jgi:hypothetical protein